MPSFEFAPDVDEDLENIARYTIDKWDAEQAMRYAASLDRHFQGIGSGSIPTRAFLKHRPELRSSRCQKHVIFHLNREGKCPLILAVFHESMDLLTRIKKRL